MTMLTATFAQFWNFKKKAPQMRGLDLVVGCFFDCLNMRIGKH